MGFFATDSHKQIRQKLDTSKFLSRGKMNLLAFLLDLQQTACITRLSAHKGCTIDLAYPFTLFEF